MGECCILSYGFESKKAIINVACYPAAAEADGCKALVDGKSEVAVEPGTTVTLTAVRSSFYNFKQWNDGDTNATRTIVANNDVTYTAEFEYDGVTLTLAYNPSLAQSEGCSLKIDGAAILTKQLAKGTSVTISATPNPPWSFSNWSDGDTNATRTITVSANTTLTANFIKTTLTLIDSYNVATNPIGYSGGITVSGDGWKNSGAFNVTYKNTRAGRGDVYAQSETINLSNYNLITITTESSTGSEWGNDNYKIISSSNNANITSKGTSTVDISTWTDKNVYIYLHCYNYAAWTTITKVITMIVSV